MNAIVSDTLVVLVVEDNPGDVVLFKEALETTRTPSDVYVVGDGIDALKFLRRDPSFADAPRPDVVVLDLNLPVKNGRDIMAELGADPALNGTPVAVLTTSKTETDVCDAYTLGLCRYFVKTADLAELVRIVMETVEFAASARNGRD